MENQEYMEKASEIYERLKRISVRMYSLTEKIEGIEASTMPETNKHYAIKACKDELSIAERESKQYEEELKKLYEPELAKGRTIEQIENELDDYIKFHSVNPNERLEKYKDQGKKAKETLDKIEKEIEEDRISEKEQALLNKKIEMLRSLNDSIVNSNLDAFANNDVDETQKYNFDLRYKTYVDEQFAKYFPALLKDPEFMPIVETTIEEPNTEEQEKEEKVSSSSDNEDEKKTSTVEFSTEPSTVEEKTSDNETNEEAPEKNNSSEFDKNELMNRNSIKECTDTELDYIKSSLKVPENEELTDEHLKLWKYDNAKEVLELEKKKPVTSIVSKMKEHLEELKNNETLAKIKKNKALAACIAIGGAAAIVATGGLGMAAFSAAGSAISGVGSAALIGGISGVVNKTKQEETSQESVEIEPIVETIVEPVEEVTSAVEPLVPENHVVESKEETAPIELEEIKMR